MGESSLPGIVGLKGFQSCSIKRTILPDSMMVKSPLLNKSRNNSETLNNSIPEFNNSFKGDKLREKRKKARAHKKTEKQKKK